MRKNYYKLLDGILLILKNKSEAIYNAEGNALSVIVQLQIKAIAEQLGITSYEVEAMLQKLIDDKFIDEIKAK